MPTVITLKDQGFYEPFRMLQAGLSARADRKQRNKEFESEQERAKMRDALEKKRVEQSLKINDWSFNREQKEAEKKDVFNAITPKAFAVPPGEVYVPPGMEGTQDAQNAIQSAQPDFTKPLHAQVQEVKDQALRMAEQTGIPIEELAGKWNAIRQAVSAPPVPTAPPEVPGYRASQFQGLTPQGMPVTYTPQPPSLFGGGMPPMGGAPVQGGVVTPVPALDAQGGVPQGLVITGVTVNAEGVPSYQLKRADEVQREANDKITSTFITSKPYQSYVKSRGQWMTLDSLVRRARENPSGADDLGIVFTYMKSLDPDSVVRESEFRTAASLGSVPERVEAWRRKVLYGEVLPHSVREQFRIAAGDVVTGLQEQAQEFRESLKTGDILDKPLPGVNTGASTVDGTHKFQSARDVEAAAAKGQIAEGDTVLVYDPGTAAYVPMEYYKE